MINGNIKFFDINVLDEDATVTLPANTIGSASYLYDRNTTKTIKSSGYNSDGSNFDIIIDFATSKYFNRIYLTGINAISGSVSYWYGTQFLNACSIGANDGTFYAEFSTITTSKILVRLTATSTPNQEKVIAECILTNEIGMVDRNPNSVEPVLDTKEVINQTANGKKTLIRFGQSFSAKLAFGNAQKNDIDLFYSLYNRVQPFYVWLCGGIGQTNFFFRSQDIYFVNAYDDFSPKPKNNLFNLGDVIKLSLYEAP